MTDSQQNERRGPQDRLDHEWGYQFVQSPHATAPGDYSLVIHIHDQPTYRHFDPERVRVTILDDNGHPDTLSLQHPWKLGERYRAYPGRIHLIDRLGMEAHAFSFGGEWHVQSQAELTRLELASKAPILNCNQPDAIACMLAVEAEILFAEQRALHSAMRDGASADKRVIEPLLIYSACLQALDLKYKDLGVSSSSALVELHHFLQKEIERLQHSGQWPDSLPGLDRLLAY